MSAPRRSRSAAMAFAAAAVTFLFTFANVSCQGQRVASLSGVQLAFGTKIDRTDMWGNKEQENVRAEPLARYALIAALAGVLLALIGSAVRQLTAIVGGTGALLLMILISKMGNDATQQSSGMLQVTPGPGLLMAIVLFGVAGLISWFGRRAPRASMAAPVPDKLPDPT